MVQQLQARGVRPRLDGAYLKKLMMMQSMELAGSEALCYSKPLIHPPASFAGQSAGILLGPIFLQVRGGHQNGATKRASGDLARTDSHSPAPNRAGGARERSRPEDTSDYTRV